MRLLPKLNLLTVSVLVILTVSVVAVGYVIIGDMVSSHNRRILATETENLHDEADRAHRILLRAGVSHVASYVTRMKEQLYSEFSSYSFGRTGSLLVLENGRTVFGDQGQGAAVAAVLDPEIAADRGAGFMAFTHDGQERFAAWRSFPDWDWIMVLSMTTREMFEQRTLYLGRVVAVAMGVLLLNWLLTSLYVRRQVGRVRRALDVVGRVGRGDLQARIGSVESGDEIGELQDGINAMAEEIAGRTAERERAEAELLKSEAKYRSLFENSVDGIFQTTPEGRYLSANPALARILGFDSPDEVMAMDVADVYADPEDRKLLLEYLESRDAVTGFEVRLLRRDGSAIWVSINVRAVRDDRGGLAVVEGSCADISLRKRAEDELAEVNRHLEDLVQMRTRDLAAKARELESANRRLRELDELKSAFLSSVSHELRTPLTSVLGFAKLIHKDFNNLFVPLAHGHKEASAKAKRILDNLTIIEGEGERLTRLVNDVLDLSKIESGRVEWRDEDITPEDLVRRSVEASRGQFDHKPEVKLSVDMEPDLPAMRADLDRMVQVLVNLLNNAAKFTAAGTVTVGVRSAPGRLEFSVSDTGIGIPEGEQARIFDKFHQAADGNTLRGEPQGTGLGLTICREIVQHYGGSIWARSTPGLGSTFNFTVPLPRDASRQPEAENVEAMTVSGDLDGDRPLVLVVDDDQAIRAYLTQLFEAEGYAVLAVADGPSALKAAERLRPDLITMDIIMPGMDGREVISQLRGDPLLKDIPILVITILQDREGTGGDVTMGKPIDETRLLGAIGGLLGRTQPSQDVLALRENGHQYLGGYFGRFADHVEHLPLEGIRDRLDQGFQGTVVLPASVVGDMDLSAVTRPGVRLLILPEAVPAS